MSLILQLILLHRPWHRPLLAQPGPWREAIHCALLSSLICPSNLIATCLLLAASRAAGVMRPTLASKHIACALTAQVEMSRRYCPTMVPRRCSDSCLPVDLQMWATLASAQLWTNECRSSEPSPQLPATYVWSSPNDRSLCWKLIKFALCYRGMGGQICFFVNNKFQIFE